MTDTSASLGVPMGFGSDTELGASKVPRRRRTEPPEVPAVWANPGAATPGVLGLRILVVEDDVLIQMLMVETLISMGHEVCAVAATETEAVEAAALSHPDLMIVDSHLQTGSGLSAVRQILLTRAIPHVFVSGDVLTADLLDPDAVTLQKPYQEPELARAIARAMSFEAGVRR